MTITFADRHRGEGRGYWHQMGTEAASLDETAAEIAVRAELDYTITKTGLMARNSRGHLLKVPDSFALLSDSITDPDVIAVVGREYEPIQNMHLAKVLDDAKMVGPDGLYAMDVCGKTSDGRLVFWSLKEREPIVINGDEYRNHWLLLDGKDGNRALTMALTPVRFVCSNALAMAVSGASIKVGISHTAAAGKELGWWMGIAPQLQAASRKSTDLLKTLGTIKVTGEDVTEVLEAAYPAPKVRGKAQLYAGLSELKLSEGDAQQVDRAYSAHGTAGLRQLKHISNVTDLFASYADTPDERGIAGTLLGVVNAVADYENHREATNSREVTAVSNMYGPRYIAQANSVRAALALAK